MRLCAVPEFCAGGGECIEDCRAPNAKNALAPQAKPRFRGVIAEALTRQARRPQCAAMSNDSALWPPPRRLLRFYLLAWAPVLFVYAIAVETDGDWTRGFDLVRALRGTVRNMGLQMALLLLIWPTTGWMERRDFSVVRQLLNHAGLAVVLAVVYYALLWLWLLVEFDLATAEKARRYWFIWQIQFGMLAYAAVAGGFHAYRAVQRAIAQARAAEQAHTLLARSELAALRNKLNPHFLFNTLHSILALVRRDTKAAEAALFRFSEMLRYLLDTERSGDDQVLLRDELAFTEQYLALEAIRLGARLQVERDIDESLLGTSVPALSLQPLVENSVKHAFNPRSQPGTLKLRVAREGAQLLLEVGDDGPGVQLDGDALPAGTGLGLRTVQRRLALQYGGAASLQIRSAPGAGFTVTLLLPLP
jgi:signal transduction histidine kinase